MKLNLKDAKRIILHGQGLLQTDQFGRGINAVQKTIEQLGYVQIDTISVVERAHHHTLRTRISNYSPKMLHKLVSDRQTVFEYWSHAAAFLPMQDYRFYQPVMKGFAKKKLYKPESSTGSCSPNSSRRPVTGTRLRKPARTKVRWLVGLETDQTGNGAHVFIR